MLEGGETSASAVVDSIRTEIGKEPLARIDYVEVVDWKNLEPVETIDGAVLVAMAVYIGKTRLIDNIIFE